MLNKVTAALIFFFSILITIKTYTWFTTIGDQFGHVLPEAIYYIGLIGFWAMITIIAPIQIATSQEIPQYKFVLLSILIFIGATFGSLIAYQIIETAETAWIADTQSATYSTELAGFVWLGYIIIVILGQMVLPGYFMAKGLNLTVT